MFIPTRIFSLVFLIALLGSYAGATSTGTVVVSSGNHLKVHSQPHASSTTLYELSNGAVVEISCFVNGDTISGSQGTTSQWDKIDSSTYGSGYASHAYIKSSDSIPSCTQSSGGCTGSVAVASGSTLRIHSGPHAADPVLYSLASGATVTLSCVTKGDTESGSQGTTSSWFEVQASGHSSGYATAAYISTSCMPSACAAPPPTPAPPAGSTFQAALNYGKSKLGTLYVGCAGGQYRFGTPAPYDMYHDGRTCGQSRVYYQPAGSVGFDCSGLMVEMFAAAGISLPYQSSTAIKDNVPQVSKSSIKNGDMLAKSGHVVMYIGNNQVIESTPYTQNSDSSWTGTRINSASAYLSSSSYSAHRWPWPTGLE